MIEQGKHTKPEKKSGKGKPFTATEKDISDAKRMKGDYPRAASVAKTQHGIIIKDKRGETVATRMTSAYVFPSLKVGESVRLDETLARESGGRERSAGTQRGEMVNVVTVRWFDSYLEEFEATEVRFGSDILFLRLADGKNRHIPLRQVRWFGMSIESHQRKQGV